jgi:hypothetical protein
MYKAGGVNNEYVLHLDSFNSFFGILKSSYYAHGNIRGDSAPNQKKLLTTPVSSPEVEEEFLPHINEKDRDVYRKKLSIRLDTN